MEIKTIDLEKDLTDKYKKEQSKYDKARYLKNKEKIQQKYIENRDKIRLYQNHYYAKNKDRYKDYYLRNAEKIKEYTRNYKIQKKLSQSSLSPPSKIYLG